MKILRKTIDPQNLKFVPRKYSEEVKLILTRQLTNISVTLNLVTSREKAYQVVTSVFELEENEYYSFEILDSLSDELTYRNQIFVTDQDFEKYSMNEGKYIEDTSKSDQYKAYQNG